MHLSVEGFLFGVLEVQEVLLASQAALKALTASLGLGWCLNVSHPVSLSY